MTTESEYKTKIVKQVKDDGGYGRRFEDQYAVGLADMIMIPKGGPVFFCEAKIIKLVSGEFYPTPRQFEELKRVKETDSGALSILMGIDPLDGMLYLNPLTQVANKHTCLVHGSIRKITESLYMLGRLMNGKVKMGDD